MHVNKYESMIPWYRLRKHLEEQLEAKRSLFENSEGVEAARLQGDVRTLRALLNIPNTLEALDWAEEKPDGTKAA